MDHIVEQCHRIRLTKSHTEISKDIREERNGHGRVIMVFPFLSCTSTCITGQTGSGKTRFVFRLLTHLKEMYPDEPPDAILYCYGIHQPLFEDMEKTIPHLVFHEGLPSMDTVREFTADRRHRLIVLDDLMHRVIHDLDMELLFTQGCHHRKLSVIFITQNIFPQGSKSRTIALNTTYLIVLKNMRDASQIATLGRQLFPGRSKLLTEAYTDATSKPYGYLAVDMSPHSDDKYRLRTCVFPGEDTIVYVPQKS